MVFVVWEQVVLFVGGAQCVLSEDVKEENEFCLGSVVMGISYFFYTVTKDLTRASHPISSPENLLSLTDS